MEIYRKSFLAQTINFISKSFCIFFFISISIFILAARCGKNKFILCPGRKFWRGKNYFVHRNKELTNISGNLFGCWLEHINLDCIWADIRSRKSEWTPIRIRDSCWTKSAMTIFKWQLLFAV
jgi:hypothetical protein